MAEHIHTKIIVIDNAELRHTLEPYFEPRGRFATTLRRACRSLVSSVDPATEAYQLEIQFTDHHAMLKALSNAFFDLFQNQLGPIYPKPQQLMAIVESMLPKFFTPLEDNVDCNQIEPERSRLHGLALRCSKVMKRGA
eukprot:m.195688 g.195688  ORF g.195688 m.195688 type:complete len:138 (-) comp14896_c0_seq1:2268-2681(-)